MFVVANQIAKKVVIICLQILKCVKIYLTYDGVLFSEFDRIQAKSRIVFNKRKLKSAGLTSDDFSGPTVRNHIMSSVIYGFWNMGMPK